MALVNFRNIIYSVGMLLGLYVIYIVTTPGGFSSWSRWSNCSVTCGGGFVTRTRSCDDPSPGYFGLECQGSKIEKQKCNEKPCPQNGGYSQWGKFGNCDKSCGSGKRSRKRTCSNPEPKYGGSNCERIGVAEESQSCNSQPCPINGGYTNWGKYSACEMLAGKACGKGKKVRTRKCSNPAPLHGGEPCQGPDKETTECEIPCPTQKLTTTTSPVKATNSTTLPTAK